MKARVFFWLLLVVGISGAGSGIAAAQVGWMQPGVRVWYLGAVGTAGGSSNAEEAYLFDSITGTNATVVHHSALTHWTSPKLADTATYPMLDMGPCWIHPARLQTLQMGDHWMGHEITLVVRSPGYGSLQYQLLPAKELLKLNPQRGMVRVRYMIAGFSTGDAYFDADTGILLFYSTLWGFDTMFFILGEINYDFAHQAAFAEDDGPHTGFRSLVSEQSMMSWSGVGGGSVIIQSLVETRYGADVEMRVNSTITAPSFPAGTGELRMADENYCFFGGVPIVKRMDATQAPNYPPEQWNPFGQYLWWWLPPTARGNQNINVYNVPMVKTSDAPLTYTATESPQRFYFSILRFDSNGYMTSFTARDPTTGLEVPATNPISPPQNLTGVDGLNYYRTEMSPDTDADGLPNSWETRFGLNANSAAGDNGASGDPDHDGRTNQEEYLAGTHPRGFFTRYFAEGAATDFFDCYFALANPSSTAANVLLRFLRDDAVTVSQYIQVPPWSRRTVNAKDVPGLAPVGGFSTVVESDVEIATDRTMTWDATGYGSHAETAVVAPAATWYLAEGATHSGFQLYYLIQNPNDTAVDVRITYLRPAPYEPIVLNYPGIAPHSRKTIYVNGEHPGLAAADISGIVTSLTPGSLIIVERAMYLNSRGLFFRAGHDSAGMTAPATDWFLAEGATGSFDLYVLVANPNSAQAHLTLTYLLPGGATVSRDMTVEANSRSTVYVNWEAPQGVSLANTAVSTKVHSDLPVLVERAMWWPAGGAAVWEEAHNSPGTTSTGTRWALADGEQGGARSTDTYILIANTSPFAGTARVTALLENGTTLVREVTVPANSRTTIYMGDYPDPQISPFGALLANTRFGAMIESLPGPSGTAELVVERAMYSNANGLRWAAGTDVVATRLGSPR